jgi:hypothetical protein
MLQQPADHWICKFPVLGGDRGIVRSGVLSHLMATGASFKTPANEKGNSAATLLRAALGSPRATSLGTTAIWLAMTLAGLWLVSRYGLKMPIGDEWSWLGQVTGDQPVTWNWLWSQHNEHRMVLPRLIYLGLGRLSGFDFRTGAYFNVVVLSGLSLLMMSVVRARRGGPSWYDAVFPLALLQWSSHLDLVWGFQLNFVISVSFSAAVLLPILSCRRRLSPRTASLIAVCLLGAGLCGAYGLAFLPPLAGWLLLAALWRPGDGSRVSVGNRLFLGGLGVALAGFCAFYFVGFSGTAYHAAACGAAAILRTTVEFFANSLGPAGRIIWPFSGLLVLGGCGLVLVQLLRTFLRRPEERLRAAGLLAWLAGMFLLAAGIGWGRTFLGPDAGFADRYTLLAAPLLCFFCLVWNAYASPRWAERLQRSLLLLLCVTATVGAYKGSRYAAELFLPLQALERDAQAGFPAAALALRYNDQYSFFATQEMFARWLERLRAAKLGPYRGRPLHALEPIVAQRMIELQHPREPHGIVAIPAGKSFVQPFEAADSGVLYRIDVQLGHFDRRRPTKLDWTLLAIMPHGGREVWAAGEIGLAALGHDDIAVLICPPRPVQRGQELEFELSNPAADSARPLRMPGYDAVASRGPNPAIKGFLFLKQSPAVAQRPTTGYTGTAD